MPDPNPGLDTAQPGAVSEYPTADPQPSQADPSAVPAAATPGDGSAADAQQPGDKPGRRRDHRIEEYYRLRERDERNTRLLQQLAERGLTVPQTQQPPNGKADWRTEGRAPREDDFPGNYEAYLDAKADWKIDQRLSQAERQRQERAQQWQQTERQQAFAAKVEKGVEKYPDFESVALSDDVPINDAMAQAMFDSDHFADIAMHLGKNPKEAARIAALSPWAAAREIGKIEDKFAQSASKGTTAAPPPPRTVSASGTAPPTIDDDNMPIEEWMARENKRDMEKRMKGRR